MREFRSFAAPRLLAMLILVVAGCGDDGGGKGTSATATPVVSTATSAPTTVATATSAPTTTAAPTGIPTLPATPTGVPTGTATATLTPTGIPTGTASAVVPTPTATPDESISPAFAEKGPYLVGVTTVQLEDREIEVWYPIDPGSEIGSEKASYASFEVLPQAIVDILPPDLNLVIDMDAYRDLPVSAAGPFPILTFSHGAGGFRHAYSAFLTGIASWGVVTASIDHLEWGLLAQVGLLPAGIDRTASDVLMETIERLSEASADPSSPLAGGVDATRIATSGHSAGGRTAFALPDRPEIKTMIGYATGSAGGVVTEKPILLMVGEEDGGAGRLEEAYEGLTPVKRFVSVDHAGHNSFTDQCAIIHGGNNFLIKLVEAGFPIPQNLLDLAIDGCRPENLAPVEFWKVAQHFTVAQMRAAFGVDQPPVGLGDGVASAFDGITMRYLQDEGDGTPAPPVMGFVVNGFRAVVPQHAGDPCPNGLNKGPVERAAAGLAPVPDDCNDPQASVDPDFRTVDEPGRVDGFDLDGLSSRTDAPDGYPCSHDDFDGTFGEDGFDLQIWRTVGCVRGFQENEITDTVVDQSVRDGSMTILIELLGVDDLENDDSVQVRVYGSTDVPPAGSDGSVLPYGTLSVHEDPFYHGSVAPGRIVDGVLIAGPIDVQVRLNIQIVLSDFTFADGVIRMRLHPDGTASGELFGFQPVEEFYDRIGRQTGQAGTGAIGFTCTGLYAALVEQADGGYDPETGKCTSISVGYRFEAVPAFLAK